MQNDSHRDRIRNLSSELRKNKSSTTKRNLLNRQDIHKKERLKTKNFSNTSDEKTQEKNQFKDQFELKSQVPQLMVRTQRNQIQNLNHQNSLLLERKDQHEEMTQYLKKFNRCLRRAAEINWKLKTFW